MDGFKLNDVSDVYVGGTLAKQVYVGSTKIWDYKTPPIYTAPTAITGLVYNGSAQTLLNPGSTSHGTFQYSLDGSTWSTSIPTYTNANASIKVYWKLDGDGRHNNVASTELTTSIDQKEVPLNWGTRTWTYDKTAHSTTCTAGNLASGDTCTVTLTGNSITNKGTATVTASSLSNSNYKLPSNKTATLTINARTVTLNWGTLSWTYDGSAHSTTCTAGNVCSGDTCTVTLTGNSITNKGTATVTASSLSNSNYALPSTKTATLNITAKTVTLNWGTASWTYDKASHSTTCTAGNLVGSDTCTVTLTGNSIGPNVGETTVTASALSNSNYALPSANTKAISISQREVTLTWGTLTWTYDKTAHSTTCTAGNLCSGDTCTVTLSGNSITNKGTTTVTASSLSNSNYKLPSSKTATLTINAKTVTLNWGTIAWVYDDAAHSTTCTAGSLMSGDTCTVTLTGNSITNKGTTTVTASSLSNSNYKLPSSKTATLTISARPINITASSTSKTFDGTALTSNSATAEATGTNRGLVSGHSMTSCTVTGTITNKGSVDNVPSAAVIKNSSSVDVTSNYDINYVLGTLTISAKALTITAKAQTIQWGNSIATGTGQVTTSGLVSGDSLTAVTLAASTSDLTQNGTITPSAATTSKGASNYSISYNTGKLIVNQRAITITAKAQTVTYGTAITTGTNQVTIGGSGLVSGHSLTAITLTASRTSVGTGTITPSAATIKNGTTDVTSKYDITYNTTGTLTISQKALTITAKNQSIAFGDSISTGTGQVTVSGLISGDSLTAVTLTASTTAVGSGTITPSAATCTNGISNYSVTYNTGTLTISKRSITITAKAQTVTFGTAISTGTSQVTTSSLGRLTLSSITLTQSTTSVTTTGTITPSAAVIKDGTTNVTSSCTLSYNTGTLTINKKALTITAKAQTITYGSSIATGTGQVTASGLISGDSLTAVTLTASTTDVPGGTITPSAATCTKGISNYNVTYNTGTLTINKVTPTVTTAPTPKVLTFNGSAQALCTTGSTDYGTLKYRIGTSGNFSTSVPTATNHSSATNGYQVYYIVEGNSNVNSLSDPMGPVNCNINEKSVTATVTLSKSSYVYSGSECRPTVTVKDGSTTINSSEYTVTYSNNINATTSNSLATVTISDNAHGNYNVVGSATFTISKRPINITAGSTSKTFDGTALTYDNATAEAAGTDRGLVSGHSLDSRTVTGSITNKGSVNNVPSNAVIKSGSTNVTSNYDITYVNGTLTISAKALTITAKAQTISFGDSIATGTGQVTTSGLVSGDSLTGISLAASTTAVTTTGTITPSGASTTKGASNYSITYNTGTLTINKRAITITAKAQTVNYGTAITQGTNQVTASNIGSFTLTAITLTQSTTNAGTGTITPSAATIKNGSTDVTSSCTITYTNGTLTINKVDPTLTTAPTAKTGLAFSGSGQALINAGACTGGTLQYKATTSSTKPTSTSGFSSTVPSQTDATTYYIWYYIKGDSNHNDSPINTTAITVTIAKKALTITAKAQSIYWGNSIATGTGQVTSSGLVSGDSLTAVTLTPSTSNLTTTGTITPSAATCTKGISNYNVTYTAGTLTISARPVTITAKAQTVTYGTAITTGTGQITTSGLVSGHSVTAVTLTASRTTAGSGTITPSAATIKNGSSTDVTSNYSITYSTGTLTVSQKALTITASAQTISFGDSITNTTAKVTTSGLISGDSLTGITLAASTTAVTTSGTITPSAAVINNGADNYSITYTNGTLKINKRAITITAKAQTVTFGTAISTGTGQVTTSSLGRLTLSSISLAASTTNVTTSGTITPSAAVIKDGTTDVTSSSCTITYNTGTLTITKKALTITAKAQTITYGNSIATGTSQVTSSGLISGDSLTAVTLTASRSTAGTGTITPSDATCTKGISNYSVTYTAGTLTINKADPTYVAPTAKTGLTYTGSAQTLTNAGTNTTAGAFTYALGTGSYGSSIPTATNANTSGYTVNWKFTPTDTSNYNTITGSLTVPIAKKAASVSGKSLTYSRGSQALTSKEGDGTFHYKVGSGSWSTTAPTATNAATYTISWYMTEGTNYKATNTSSAPGSVSTTIAKCTPVLSTSPTYRTGLSYTGSAQNLLTGGAMKHSSSDSTAVAGTFTYDQGTNAGTYSSKKWYFAPTDTTNYNSTNGTVSGSTSIAQISVHTAPVANSTTYTGSAIALLKNGSANGKGTLEYSTNGTSGWTTTVPTQTNAGSYDTWWRFTPTDTTNHNSVSATKITTTISKAAANLGTPNSPTSTFSTSSQTISIIISGASGTVTYPTSITVKNSSNTTVSGWSCTGRVVTVPASTNAGTYTVTGTISVAASTNYNSGSGSKTWTVTISPMPIAIPNPGTSNNVYSASAFSLSIGPASGATITKYRYSTNNSSWTETTTNPSLTSVGTLYVQAYHTAQTNFTGSGWSTSGTITVTARPINITAGSTSKTYDGTSLEYSHATAEAANGDRGLISGHTYNCKVNGTITNPGSTSNDLGEATIMNGEIDVTNNYSITYISGTLTVNKYTPTVALSGTTLKAYDGNGLYATVIAVSKPINGAAAAITGRIYYGTSAGSTTNYAGWTGSGTASLFAVSQINPGSTTVYAHFVPDSTSAQYYNNSGDASRTFTVNKYTPTITLSATNRVYNGNALYATATVSKPTNGKAISGTIHYGTSAGSHDYHASYSGSSAALSSVSQTNVGSKTVYAYFNPDNTCIDVYHNSPAASKTFTVSIADGYIDLRPATWINDLTYSGSQLQLVGVYMGGIHGGGTAYYRLGTSGSWSTSFPKATNAGTYTVYYYLTADPAGNYAAIGSSSNPESIQVTIAQKVATLNWGTTSWEYNGSTHSTTCTSDGGTVTLSGNSVGPNVGSATVTATALSNANYKLPSAKTQTISISRASRTISFTTAPTSVDLGGTITVAALPSAGSGDGTITYSSSNTSIASVSGSTITGVAEGTVTITATISQGTNYYSATTTYTLNVVDNVITATYYTALSGNLRVLSYTTGISSVEIDGVVQRSVSTSYKGLTAGTHTVKFTLSGTTIAASQFSRMTMLTDITIPGSVTSIGQSAFVSCTELKSITCKATTAPSVSNQTFRSVGLGGTLYVPSGATGYDTWMGTGNYYLGKVSWTQSTI